jgi:hypothetical protein
MEPLGRAAEWGHQEGCRGEEDDNRDVRQVSQDLLVKAHL